MNLSGGCYPALLVEMFACFHTELVEVASGRFFDALVYLHDWDRFIERVVNGE